MDLRIAFYLAEDHGLDVDGTMAFAADHDARFALPVSFDRVAEALGQFLDLRARELTADEALDLVNGELWIRDDMLFCGLADELAAISEEGDHRRHGVEAGLRWDDPGNLVRDKCGTGIGGT